MTHRVASKLASAEWDFLRIDAALADLAGLLHDCAEESPDCTVATLTLKAIRKRLNSAWKRVERDVGEANAIKETVQAPF